MKKAVLFIVGPTAAGKSRLGYDLARRLNGEIISADSMQVYRGMDIGTAKPSRFEQETVPHHLIDILDPSEEFSVSRFYHFAVECIARICARGRTPVVVGGTGLYVRSLLQGLRNVPAGSEGIRERLDQEACEKGLDILYARLCERDAEAAARIKSSDKRRVIRALEICELKEDSREAGEIPHPSLSDLGYGVKVIGLKKERAQLYRDIDARVDAMMSRGLLDEVLRVSQAPLSRTAKQAVGYKELLVIQRGRNEYDATELGKAVDLIKQRSRNFAKRQFTWFSKEPVDLWLEWDDEASFGHVLRRAFEAAGSLTS